MIMLETIFYLLLNLFRVYIMYRFVGLFFERSKQKKGLLYGYLVFYTVSSFESLFLQNDWINLVTNIGGFLLVTILMYQGSIKRKLLATVAGCGIALLAEDIAWVIFVKGLGAQLLEFGFFFSVFILFLLEIVIEKTVRLRKGIDIPLYKNLLLVLISTGSMFICIVLIEEVYQHFILLMVSLCVLLTINILVFYLYEKLVDDYVKEKDEEMYRLQLAMYQKQLQIMQSANDSYKIMRHDIKYHMALIADYIKNNENEKALQYFGKMNYYIGNGNQYVKTGNESIDSIFNYIIDEVNKKGGTVSTDIKVIEGMAIDDFDINVILSNLLLNACEAVSKCDKKEIQAFMKYDRGILSIKISNTYNGIVRIKDGELLSTKQEGKGHGIGLVSVRKAVEKYNGVVRFEYTDEKFTVKVLMYI